jgi:hypothetical protein
MSASLPTAIALARNRPNIFAGVEHSATNRLRLSRTDAAVDERQPGLDPGAPLGSC